MHPALPRADERPSVPRALRLGALRQAVAKLERPSATSNPRILPLGGPGMHAYLPAPGLTGGVLHEVMARTPLRTWTGQFGRTPEQILAVPSDAWAPVLFTGWSRAAMAQRDQDWMTALVDWALAGGPTGTRFGAETLRQLARRADPARCARETTAGPAAEIPLPIRDAIGVLIFEWYVYNRRVYL